MYDEATDQPAMVNSTDLNEDLGQIEHLFLDKTGTLTENQMVFKHFSIDGHTYEEVNGQLRMLNSNEPLSLKVAQQQQQQQQQHAIIKRKQKKKKASQTC